MEKIAFTIKEAADALGVAESTIRKMVTAGQLPVRRIGVGRGKLLVPAQALEDLFKAGAA